MNFYDAYYPFSQGNILSSRAAGNSKSAGGACHAFSLHWLRLVLTSVSSQLMPGQRMAELNKNRGGSNPLLQYALQTRYEPEELMVFDQMLMRLRGLKYTERVQVRYSPYCMITLFNRLSFEAGAYFYGFWYRQYPGAQQLYGHATAFYRTQRTAGHSGHILFYDPNLGEFYVLPSKFFPFWLGHAAKYGCIEHHILRSVEIDGKDSVDGY
ncbi:hypothetical protein [Endozoicomonas sp. GU-1]|uniref:hypothetical protein n=1 Tax=Endozoicomonas sp. GU-1 TaxID=3009078 RepID=UPI0022B3F880|nr:hypothetical protein [Endozoicomonas sp. GU-1]WBA83665.1 hypothetical protein O2T12_11350 [Endozoicomonas sp. GU-1]WBA86644.1 hypothetical protein O3276_00920 [Endozoicomonas sp. GU-1]